VQPNPAFAAGGPSRPRLRKQPGVLAAEKEELCLRGGNPVARS
jgi:hypothetical protein